MSSFFGLFSCVASLCTGLSLFIRDKKMYLPTGENKGVTEKAEAPWEESSILTLKISEETLPNQTTSMGGRA